MSKPVRIGIVLAQTTGGIGRHAAALTEEAVSSGASVTLFAPNEARGLGFEEKGASFYPFEIPASLGAAARLPSAIRELRRGLGGMDLAHGHGIRAGLAASYAARGAGVRQRVVTIHNAVLDRRWPIRAAAWGAEVALARLATARICVSSDLASAARSAAPRRADTVLVIPVGADLTPVNPKEVAAARASIQQNSGVPLVVAVGRLHRQKGFDILIEAAACFGEDSRPMVAIAGEGPARADLEKLVRQRALGGRVLLLGHRADARAICASADLFCMPSRWEGSPLALHEAMAAGRPVVATRVGGIPAMTQEAAVLVDPEDPAALAVAIQRVLKDSALAARLASAAGRRARAWPDAQAGARRVILLYEQFLGRPLGGSR